MADKLRPRLARLEELSKKVNATTDDAGRVVHAVESYLSDVLHLGVKASVLLEYDEDENNGHLSKTELVYGRCGSKFRLYVHDFVGMDGTVFTDEQTPWANCPRDVKLLAFNCLPGLLDKLIESLEDTLDLVETSGQMIQSLLPPHAIKEKGAKS
jgi:hypothetical protein